ncbi:hypothetical protein BH18ACT1_BH18ACT1_09220 [soil metagenome]
MRRATAVLGMVGALVLGVVAPAPAQEASGRSAASATSSPPDELGPYEVGRTTLTLKDTARNDRTLPVDVWYPVDAEDAVDVPASEYDLLLARLRSEVALAEPVLSDEGPFPLVVFSHGSGGVRYQSYFLTEVLASHGFVVAAPDHVGNTTIDLLLGTPAPFGQSARDRPKDVSFVIDELLERSRTDDDPLAGAGDGDHIGVAGHSFGGYTDLAAATTSAAGPADPRVDAIVPISPASGPFSDEALAAIEVPMLVLGGTADTTTPIDPSSTRPYALAESRRRFRVDVDGAGHASFTNICDFYDTLAPVAPANILEFLSALRDDGCGPDLVPIAEAQRLTNYYTVAFFQRFIGGELGYGRYLRPSSRRTDAESDVTLFARGRDEGRRCASVARGPRCERRR